MDELEEYYNYVNHLQVIDERPKNFVMPNVSSDIISQYDCPLRDLGEWSNDGCK